MADFRSYDSAIGRWLQVDPMSEEAASLTPYRFGFNNPLGYSDPLGLFETKQEAKEYRRNTDGLNWFNSSVNKQSDGSYAIETRTSSTQKVTDGETLEALGVEGGSAVVTSALSRAPSSVQSGAITNGADKVAPLGVWDQLNGGVVGNGKYNRDGYYTGPAPYAGTVPVTRGGTGFSALRRAVEAAYKRLGVERLPKYKDGKWGSPQRGNSSRGIRYDKEGHPLSKDPAEQGPHINWWDYTGGKRKTGGEGETGGAFPINQ